mgnify:CR=1 FL=1
MWYNIKKPSIVRLPLASIDAGHCSSAAAFMRLICCFARSAVVLNDQVYTRARERVVTHEPPVDYRGVADT